MPQNLSQELNNWGMIPLLQNNIQSNTPIIEESSNSIFDLFDRIKENLIDTYTPQENSNKETSIDIKAPQENNNKEILTDNNQLSGENSENVDISNHPFIFTDFIEKYFGTENNYLHKDLCLYSEKNIVYISGGTNTLPEYLSGNTIYLLESGSYIFDYMLKITENCTAIIGEQSGTILYTKENVGAAIKVIYGENHIFENLYIEAKEDGNGESHIGNNYGIFLSTSRNILSNIKIRNQERFGIYMENFDNKISDSNSYITIEENTENTNNNKEIKEDNENKNSKEEFKKLLKIKLNKEETIEISPTNEPLSIDNSKTKEEIESDLIRKGFKKEGNRWKGKVSLDLAESEGEIPIPIILESLDGITKVEIPENTILETENGDPYKGIIIPPQKDTKHGFSISGSKIRSAITIKVGSLTEGLKLKNISGEVINANIQMPMDGYKSGDNVIIYSSEDGINREQLGNFEVQEISGVTIVDVPTNHFSYLSAGTFIGRYFKGIVDISEYFEWFEQYSLMACSASINGGVWRTVNDSTIGTETTCSTTRTGLASFNIVFRVRLLDDGGIVYNNNLIPKVEAGYEGQLLSLLSIFVTGGLFSYTYDVTAPINGSFSINNGAATTNSTSVTLNTTCPTDGGVGGVQMSFSNNGTIRTNRTSCTSSVAHTLTAGDETKTVYMRFQDALGNITANITDTIVLSTDTTAPTYEGFTLVSAFGSYQDGNIYRVQGRDGTEISFKITHSDNSQVGTQYFSLTSGSTCTPNNCGGAPYEIKSYNNGSHTDRMTWDDYLDIYSSDCSDTDLNCTDNDLTRTWRIIINYPPDLDYRMRTFLYDAANNGVGYTNMNAWLKIDGTPPVTTITSPVAGSRQGSSINMGITDVDTRSGLGQCKYTIKNNGTTTLLNGTRTCNSGLNINTPTYCSTQGSNTCEVLLQSYDNVGGYSPIISRLFSIDTVIPTFTFNNASGNEGSAGSLSVISADGGTSGLPATPYAFSTNGSTRGSWTSSATYSLTAQPEPTSTTIRAKVRDVAGNETIKSATYTWNNVGPTMSTLTNNGPIAENTTITFTAVGSDTGGGTLQYEFYAGACGGTIVRAYSTTATYSRTETEPITTTIYARTKDANGLGSSCLSSNGVWTNVAPTANNISNSANEGSTVLLTSNVSDPGGTTFTYQRYSNSSCSTTIAGATSSTYTAPAQTEPTSIIYYYKAFDTQGLGSNCASATATWNNIAPSTPTQIYPANGSRTNDRQFCAQVSDIGGGNVTAYFVIGGITRTGTTVASNSYSCYNGLSDLNGIGWYVYAKDSNGGQSANSTTWTAYIDTEYPAININYPSYGNWYNLGSEVEIEIEEDDNIGLGYCYYSIYDDGNTVIDMTERTCGNTYLYIYPNEVCTTEGAETCTIEISNVDTAGNRSYASTAISIDGTFPTYIWNTPAAGGRYKSGSIISIDATISEYGGSGIPNGSTCGIYVDNGSYYLGAVNYSGITSKCVGNITMNNVIPNGTHNFNLYIGDSAGNTTARSSPRQFFVDKQAPTFTFSNSSGPECTAGTLSMTAASDGTGAGLHATPYSFNNSTWSTTTSTGIAASQANIVVVRTGRVRDTLDNASFKTVTYTFTNTAPTASNFTGHASVGNTARTVSWKILSSVIDGTCGNTDITYSGIITQGTKGVCSVVGDNITYTPNTNQIGIDSCTIQVKDNENSTVNIIVGREGIDTDGPTAAPSCTTTQYFSGSLTVTCTVGAGGTQIRYTTNGVDPSPSDTIWSNQSFSSTTTLKAISCDALNNCYLSAVETETYTKDTLAPVSTISDTNSNWRNTDLTFTTTGTDAGVKGVSLFYKILSGDLTCSAGGFTSYTYPTAISVTGTTAQALLRTVCFYSTDSLGNTETINKQLYKIDMSDPAITAPAIYGGTYFGTYFKGAIDLRSSISDIGAGILASSCMRSINAAAFTNVGVTQDASYCIYNTYNPAASFNIKLLVKDQANNTGTSLQSDFTYDATAPTIGLPAIYAGTTHTTYYKGTINIQSTATDVGSNINSSTCEYSINNGTSWLAGTYAGGYCQIASISPATNLQILMRAKDNLGTTGTSSLRTYTYDATAPITTNNATSSRTNTDQTITLSPTDAGAGVANTYYCITTSGGDCTPNILGTSILVTGNINEITSKQIKYYSTDNLNTDETIKTSTVINIDKQGPTINLISPENDSIFENNILIELTWSGNDNGAGMSGYRYRIFTGETTIISGFTENTGILVSGLNVGTYSWNITAIDNIQQETTSEIRTLTIGVTDFVIIPTTTLSGDTINAFIAANYILSGGTTLIGYKPIDMALSNGSICPQLPIIFQSTGDINGNKIEIEFPGCFYPKNENGSVYTGKMFTPEFNNIEEGSSSIKVGSPDQSIHFKNQSNENIQVTMRIPILGRTIGEIVKVYYSEDDINWILLTSAPVINYNGQPYVEFQSTHFTTFTVGAIQWDNNNFLTEEFWNNNPTDTQIIRALYGDGSGGTEKTAYTKDRSEVGCITGNMSVIHLTGGTGSIPINLATNTIYALASGTYISTGGISMNNCSAIIGKTSNINLHSSITLSSTSQGLIYNANKKYNIVDNLNIDGMNNGIGGSHSMNTNGLLYHWYSENQTANKIKTYNNSYGIRSVSYSPAQSSKNIKLNDVETYNIGSYGIHIDSYSDNFIVTNSKISSNNNYGIRTNGSGGIFDNIIAYNNNNGIYIQSSYNKLSNIQAYNNAYGIVLSTTYNILNNIQTFNNTYGIYIPGGNYNTINNFQSYNNSYGLYIAANYVILNNIEIYNNSTAGISMNNSSGTVLNKTIIRNNTIGISLNGTLSNNKYYDKIVLTENDENIIGILTGLSTGNTSDYSLFGRTGGFIEINSGCFRCANITNPININSGALTNTGNYRSCNSKGKINGRAPITGETINYIYGISLSKQVQPVIYSGNILTGSNLTYSGNLYIGEINKLTENTDTTCNDCSSNYSANWDNTNFITGGFWSQNPNSCDIIAALYGTGREGENKTAYTSNRSGVQNGNLCDVENMRVLTVTPGTDKLPGQLIANTIYILDTGNYITSGNGQINLNNCSAIIAKDGTGYFFSTGYIGQIIYGTSKKNIILENISINGTGNGIDGSHNANSNGLYIALSKNNTLNNIEILNNGNYGLLLNSSTYNTLNIIQINSANNVGIRLESSSNYNIFNNIKANKCGQGLLIYSSSYNEVNNYTGSNNVMGLYMEQSANYNILNNVKIYNSSNQGFYFNGASNYNIFNNMEIYNTTGIAINFNSANYNTFNNTKAYNNTQQGINVNSTYNTFNNTQTYNNGSFGIYAQNATYTTLNNIQSYNNSNGIGFSNSHYNAVNNSQSYNNTSVGFYFAGSNYNIINNSQSYNNGTYGVYLSNTSGAVLHNIISKNNQIGIYLDGTSNNNRYYDRLILMENEKDINGILTGISTGLSDTYSSFGRSGGYTEVDSGCFRCADITNPINISSGVLTNTGTYRSCNSRGKIAGWTPANGELINYIYGISLPKQTQTVLYSGTTLLLSGTSFDTGLYIGEVNSMGTNTDTTCNDCNTKYTTTGWDNSNFITGGFWDQNPNSCDVIAALYGTGRRGEDQTAYTTNRSGFQNGNLCDTENMRVSTGSPGTDIFPVQLSSNTIYVIESGNYINSSVPQINLNNCSAIITKNGTGYFFSTGTTTQLIYGSTKKNIILDNIGLNGTGNGVGGFHNKNTYGIQISSSTNSALRNIQGYNNTNNGLYLGLSNSLIKSLEAYNNNVGIYITNSYNTIDTIKSYKNSGQGVQFNYSSYNNISNIECYNNSSYGFQIDSNSTYNTINNISSYGNNNVGLWISQNATGNTINNIKTYYNTGAGIYIQGNSNILNNIQSFNNNTYGIEFSISVIKYNILKNLQIYDNTNGGISIPQNTAYNKIDGAQLYRNGISLSNSSNTVLNNIQTYNGGTISIASSPNTSLNNIQVYNNNGNGIYISTSPKFILNNILAYNNGGNGIYIGNNSTDGILNNIKSYNNNTGIYIYPATASGTYYGNIELLENDRDIGGSGERLSTGINSSIGWNDGSIDINSGCFRCASTTYPINNYGTGLIDTGIYWNCNLRAYDMTWRGATGTQVSYIYGSSVPKQVQPREYSGTTEIIIGSGINFDTNKFIGEVNNSGTNSDATCNDCNTKYIATGWNNDNFITGGFWDLNPNDCDILAALYGTGRNNEDKTAYTTNRSLNTCDTENMRVSTGTAGTGILPQQLPTNTIYILSGGNYITTGTINTNNCSAIIIKNGTGFFYSTGSLTNGMFNNNTTKKNNIFENITIDGTGNGRGGSHVRNTYGLYIFNQANNTLNNIQTYNNQYGITLSSSNFNILNNIKGNNNDHGIYIGASNYNILNNIKTNNNTINGIYLLSNSNYNTLNNIKTNNNTKNGISLDASLYNGFNNIKSYNNINQGIRFDSSSNYNIFNDIECYDNIAEGIRFNSSSNYNILNNIQTYNNNYGINIQASNYNLINNTSVFNNKQSGILFGGSEKNTISNNSISNNATYGIYIGSSTSGNIIYNTSIYNNLQYGIYFYNSSSVKNNIFNNINIYNNTTGLYIPVATTGNYIYNNLNMFSNKSGDVNGPIGNLLLGSGDTYSGLGWTTGNITASGILGRSIFSNPKNISGTYLLPWTGTAWTSMIGNRTFTGSENIQTSYGYDLPRQTQPVIYSGTILILSGTYDTGKYIGGDVTAFTGSLSGWVDSGNNHNIDITPLSDNATEYTLFGNLAQTYTGTIGILRTITFTSGTGTKTVFAQIYDSNNFATHFVNTTLMLEADDSEAPIIIFTGSTPADNATITGNTFSGLAEITEQNLASLIRNRNGINYPIYDSGLVLMMNFDNKNIFGENSSTVKDISLYNNTGVIYETAYQTGKYNTGLRVNKTNNGYIEIPTTGKLLEAFDDTFTVSFRYKPDSHPTTSRYQIFEKPYNSHTIPYYQVIMQHTRSGEISATVYQNNTSTYLKYLDVSLIHNTVLELNKRYLITLTTDISGGEMKLYINGNLDKEDTTPEGSYTNRDTDLRMSGIKNYASSTYYTDATYDELRVYNRTLSSGEVLQLYRTNLAKTDTDKRQFTTQQQCLPDGNYPYNITATDTVENTTTTGRDFTIQLPNLTIGSPLLGLNLPSIASSKQETQITEDFSGVDNTFRVYDTKGYTGWYSTIQLSGDLSNQEGTLSIPQENIQFKANDTITLLEGIASSGVALATGINEYKTMTGIYNYIVKNITPECSSCIIGKYGNNPSLKITIPAYQKPDLYDGTLIFTLYN